MKPKKGNLLDLFFILAVLLGGVGVIMRGVSEREKIASDTLESYTVLLEAKSVPYEVSDCIFDEASLYTLQGEYFGTLEEHQITPAKVSIRKDGQDHSGYWQEDTFCDVRLSVRVEGLLSDHGFLRGGQYAILCGQEMTLYSDHAQISCVVLDFYSNMDRIRAF